MGMITVYDANGVKYDIPENSRVTLQGLDIIGDGIEDWNEPIQKNLVLLSNKTINDLIEAKSYTDVSFGSLDTAKADKNYVDTQLSTKQNTLTAGNNITISNGVISADDTSVDWDEITSKPSFATIATSGSYNDLSNKPMIPTVPTTVSSFTNDAGYLKDADFAAANITALIQ